MYKKQERRLKPLLVLLFPVISSTCQIPAEPNGIQEVVGSIPISSTIFFNDLRISA
jgi:hypothetical protein